MTRFVRKQCGGEVPAQEPIYCSSFVGCCGNKCCTTEDLTFIFVWAAIALVLIVVITCMICLFKKKQTDSTKMPSGSTGKLNMTSVFNVVLMNEGKGYNQKMAGKAKRADMKPLLRISESSCGSEQQDLTGTEHQDLTLLKTIV